jgi:chemotaxis protein MotB
MRRARHVSHPSARCRPKEEPMSENLTDGNEGNEFLLPSRRRLALPIAAALAVVIAIVAVVWAWRLRGDRNDAASQAAKLATENKSLTDALDLLRASSGDLGGKLNSCKEELTTQATNLDDIDKRRTALETDLAGCQSSVKDLKQESLEQAALLAEFKGLTARFQGMIDSGKLDVVFRRGKMVVKLPDSILFPSGSADLSEGGKSAIADVASILKQMSGRRFTVAGHTDNIPVSSKPFKDNWELSAMRAVKVTEMLVDKGVPAGSLVAAGYSQHDPVSSNGSASGRQRNRRIEIILEPNLRPVPPKLLKAQEKATKAAAKSKAKASGAQSKVPAKPKAPAKR